MSTMGFGLPLYQQSETSRPRWTLKRVAGPAQEVVDVATAKAWCRQDSDADDAVIFPLLITVVREQLEAQLGISMLSQTFVQSYDRFPWRENFLEIFHGPVTSVDAVTYTDSAGNTTTMSPGTDYKANLDVLPAQIVLPFAGIWPTAVLDTTYPVKIAFTAGYAADASQLSNIPQRLIHVMALMLATLYDNRQHLIIGTNMIEIPNFVSRLTATIADQIRTF